MEIICFYITAFNVIVSKIKKLFWRKKLPSHLRVDGWLIDVYLINVAVDIDKTTDCPDELTYNIMYIAVMDPCAIIESSVP